MKTIFTAAVFVFSSTAWSLSMKLEGFCAGKLADGTQIAFQYYSNFDGCREVSRAAISFNQGREGMIVGKRSFTESSDVYNFGKTRLTFPNSTGNTSGKYRYVDSGGGRKTVTIQCDVRDYEYTDCE